MRRTPDLLIASALFATLLLTACMPLPPTTDAAVPSGSAPAREALSSEAESAFEFYQLLVSGASQEAAADPELYAGVATAEHAISLAEEHQAMLEVGVELRGVPTTESFELIDDSGMHYLPDILAIVCSDPSTRQLVDRSTGAVLGPAEGDVYREALVAFERGSDGVLLVAGRSAVDDPGHTCA